MAVPAVLAEIGKQVVIAIGTHVGIRGAEEAAEKAKEGLEKVKPRKTRKDKLVDNVRKEVKKRLK